MVSEIVGINQSGIGDYLPIKIYPKPAKDILYIELIESGTANIRVYSLAGKEFFSKSTKDQKTGVDISQLSRGNYLMKVVQNRRVYQVKVYKHQNQKKAW